MRNSKQQPQELLLRGVFVFEFRASNFLRIWFFEFLDFDAVDTPSYRYHHQAMSSASNPSRLIIVGAGPAGLMAGIAAARAGAKVQVCEQLDRPGAKLSAAGGGRGNLTIRLSPAELAEAFGRQGRFILPAVEAMGPRELCEFLGELGIRTASPDGLHVYPASNHAAQVTAALVRQAGRLGVELHFRTAVQALAIEGGHLRGVRTTAGALEADGVILACGGRSYADLGGTGGGYALARQAGHTLIQPVPGLVPLVTAEKWPTTLAGVSVPDAAIRIDLSRQRVPISRGDLLFTHRGVSGPAVLNISGRVARLLEGGAPVPIALDFAGGAGPRPWAARLDEWRISAGGVGLRGLLAHHLPRALVDALCERAGVPTGCRAAELSRPVRQALLAGLSAAPLSIPRTEGFERAMVTCGGVSLKEVDPRTLCSRLVWGLAFAGELLDLDGPTGGYNLQWAFASGHLAGTRWSFRKEKVSTEDTEEEHRERGEKRHKE